MIDFSFLKTGMNGLANAHKAGTMAGHLGAAVVAGYFFGEDHSGLPKEVFRGVEGELQRIIAGEESFWWNAKKAGVTPADLFQPLPKEEPRPETIGLIVEALQKNVGETRQSGHNIIFASLAVRALHDHPDFATPLAIAGVCRLTQGFNRAHAGRGYYGKEQGWQEGNQVKLTPDNNFPKYESLQQMVDVTLGELIDTAGVKKQGFGGLWHLVNHAAAITELHRFGYQEAAQQALPAHHQHIRLWRSLPDIQTEFGPVVKSEHDPREAIYWQQMLKRDEARLTHRIKTLYGFYTIRAFITNKNRRQMADDAFLYLMA
ncbi:hypothetical protein [Lignipirellula cremea]|uniref:Uncharacterized protein n=1 Tax=Lignipirellula cremea TaxID=2528010 RepID=A0A518DZC8_9BACT|nr:hypothetical protein [Lignipirellula cremea]QDU97198.1 hypothetical protein Pla8534_50430 [Lignipirellula cremea]